MKRKITCVLLLAFAMLSYQTTHSQTKGVTVTGNCFLEGQTNHSGIKVLFTAVSPSAVTTEVFTGIDGAFVAGLVEGIYLVEYSKTGYWPYTLPGNISFFTSTTLNDVTLIPGLTGTLEVSGPQSGVWESGYLVKALANISVPAGDTLIIQPGVTVKFMGNFAFEIYGTLLAAGMEGDSIIFTSGQPVAALGDWQYIHFYDIASSGSVLAFSKVQYANFGIFCESSGTQLITNCKIINNSMGIHCSYYSSPDIQNNTFNKNNFGILSTTNSSPTIQNNMCNNNNEIGIYCDQNSSPTILNNICNNNRFGIYCGQNSSPIIQYNICNNNNEIGINCSHSSPTIRNNNCNNNTNFGIYCNNSFPIIQNNICNNNSNGIYCTSNSSPIIQNNTICQSRTAGICSDNSSAPAIYNNILAGNQCGVLLNSAPQTLSYNLFWENTTLYEGAVPASFGQIVTQNANGDPCDTYLNLFMDPQFAFTGEYTLEACTNLPNDEFPENDCKTKIVTNSGDSKSAKIMKESETKYNEIANLEENYDYKIKDSTDLFSSYCEATTADEDEYIAKVLFGSINNSSGWQGGVADYTALYTQIEAGISQDITITNGNAWASDIVYCWVDWNKDFNFSTSDEQYVLTNIGGQGQTFTGTITVPAGTLNGFYRLRIRMTYTAVPFPCGVSTYGEVEDYGILVGNNFENDMCVLSIVNPSSGFDLGADEPITIKILNFGVIQSNIPYSVFWSGGLINGNYSGVYDSTLNYGEIVDVTLPVTVDFTPNYHLQPTSPCIDAGNPDTAYYDPDGTIADIGAYYFDQGSAAPVINNFTATPVTGRMPLVVQFSQDISGPATEYEWVFGDGSTSTLPNPVHVYNAMGYYTVSLMATGPGGSDILVKTDYIFVQAPIPPLNAAFTGTPLLGYAPLEVQFTNQSTGPWQTLLWDFGDGSTSTDLNPLHVYQQPGDYSVSLTLFVTSTEKTELKENYIHAIAPQEVVAMFGVSGNNGAAPYTVAFFDESFGSVDSLSWDFGDGATSTLANPTHVYLLPGEYTATLTAYGPLNTGTASETILVESVAPVILAITDRPDDQGGYVYVQFKKSFYDNVIPGKSTESYTIQRQDNGHWVSLNTSLAYGEAVYTVEAATLNDSTAQSPGITAFRVIAGMDEGTWISQPGEGWSVDNIAPSTPDGMDWLITGSQLEFSWNPCPDEDFRYFAVYKSDENGLFPEIPVATLTGTSFSVEVDPDEVFIYAVTAFDFAGNESLFSDEISNLDRQEILIPCGWSGISGYLEPYNSQIENLFAPIMGNLTILMNETGMYWPGQNVNTLGTWQINQGYQIKMNQQTGYFLRGFKLTDHSLGLASGWSLMPVLSENNADVTALFASTGLELIKEVAGFRLYWPAYGINTLGYLEPGRSYQVLMEVPGTINFPTEPVKSIPAKQPPPVNITSWNEIMPTPVSHAIAFSKVACSAFETGDIIAVFTSEGLCAGMQPYNSGTLGLIAFGDDGITADRDGFLQGEALDFRLFRPTTGEQFNLEVTYDNNMNTGDFTENGISVVTSVKVSPLMPETIHPDEISIFPNPSRGLFSITGIETQADIAIFNAFGLEVTNFRVTLPVEIDLSGQPKGVYFLQIKSGEGIFIKKLVLN